MTAAGCLAFFSSVALSRVPGLSSYLASFLAAALVGCAGNLYSRATGRPALPVTTSGVFILVPGCMALRGLNAMLADDALASMRLTGSVLVATVALGAGVFLASLLVPPRESIVVKLKAYKHAFVQHGGYKKEEPAPLNFL